MSYQCSIRKRAYLKILIYSATAQEEVDLEATEENNIRDLSCHQLLVDGDPASAGNAAGSLVERGSIVSFILPKRRRRKLKSSAKPSRKRLTDNGDSIPTF